jgi:hypothetical protein
MKRAIKEVTEDLLSLERALDLIKRQRTIIREEWYSHPESIRKQLELWKVPNEVIENNDVVCLLVDYEPDAESETVGAGTVLVERDDWSISIGLGAITHTYLATRWTGGEWEGDFCILEDDTSWDTALSENDGEITKAIASMGLAAFYKDGEDSIIKVK